MRQQASFKSCSIGPRLVHLVYFDRGATEGRHHDRADKSRSHANAKSHTASRTVSLKRIRSVGLHHRAGPLIEFPAGW